MIAAVAPQLRLLDALSATGLGLGLAAWYDLTRFFCGKGKIRIFVCDVFIGVLAAVLLISFALSKSYSGVLRWYMAAGALGGYAAYFMVAAPITAHIFSGIHFVLALPFRQFYRYVLRPFAGLIVQTGNKIRKMRQQRRETPRNHLRKDAKVLYNSKYQNP
ncbi:MAG: spore cortex biosynthesis protein YabQ [Pygmaiobacter sp.]